MKLQINIHEKIIIDMVAQCYIEQYTNPHTFDLLVYNANMFIKLVYENYHICNPYVLEQAFNYYKYSKSPSKNTSKKISLDKKCKFKRFLKLHSLPYYDINVENWKEYKKRTL
jgi:hypothetical protein